MLLLLLLMASATAADSACYRANSSWEEPQLLEAVSEVPGPAECQLLCQDNQNCTAWTWTSEKHSEFLLYCFLLSDFGNRIRFRFFKQIAINRISFSYQNSVSGPASCTCSSATACQAGSDNSLASQPGVQQEQQCQGSCQSKSQAMLLVPCLCSLLNRTLSSIRGPPHS